MSSAIAAYRHTSQEISTGNTWWIAEQQSLGYHQRRVTKNIVRTWQPAYERLISLLKEKRRINHVYSSKSIEGALGHIQG